MALAIDGTPVTFTATNATSVGPSGTLTTTSPNDVVVVVASWDTTAAEGAVTVSGITNVNTTGTLSAWTKRSGVAWTLNYQNLQLGNLEVWWATSGGVAWSGTVTVNTGGAQIDNAVAFVFAVSGADTTTPFDTNASIPKTATNITSTSSIPTVSGVSTTNANTMLLGVVASVDNVLATTQTAGASYTLIATGSETAGINQDLAGSERQIVSSTQSNVSVAFGTSWPGWGMIADAIQASGAALTLGGAMPLLMMSRRRRDPVKTLILPSRYARRTRGFAVAA